MSKVNVKENLSSGKWVREVFRKRKKQSEIWSYFYRVRDTATKELVPLAFCEHCHDSIKFPTGCSSSNLKGHKCYRDEVNQPSTSSSAKKIKPNEGIRQDVLDGCVSFVGEDMRSFHIVKGTGFKKLVTSCVRAGAAMKTCDFDVDDIIPHPTSVSRRLKEKHESNLNNLVEELRPRVDNGQCSASLDLWTDKHSNKNFLTFNVNYLDAEWKLQCRNLFTIQMYSMDEFGNPKTKSAENITKAIECKLKEIGLEGRLQKFIFVTDQGSNLIKMCTDQNLQRLDCAAHVLNTVLTNVFSEAAMKKDAPLLHQLLTDCKALVEHFKRSSLQELLSTRLKQHCKTRWNTHAEMLYSISKNYDEIFTILSLRDRIKLLDNIDPATLDRLLVLLKPFKKATQFFEGDYVTIHQVMLKVKELEDHLTVFAREEENKELKWIATRCLTFLGAKFKFSEFHKIAAFLWPACRQMLYLKEVEREDVNDVLRKSLGLDELTSTSLTSSLSQICEDETEENTTDPSISSLSSDQHVSDFLKRHRDLPPAGDSGTPIEVEIKTYKQEYTEDVHNVLGWWRENAARFPALSALARRIFAITATSAASERMFSRSGRILEDRRGSLSTNSLEACMFVSSNSS